MRTGIAIVQVVAAVSLTATASALEASEPCPLLLLHESDRGVQLERVELSPGTRRTIELSAESGYLTFAIPRGEGMSAEVIQRQSGAARLEAACVDSALELRVVRADGRVVESPPVPLAEFSRFDLRLNVVGGDGSKRAFQVRSGGRPETASGPVMDLFGGRIPLAAGDYAVTTETSLTKARTDVAGEVEITFDGEHFFATAELPDGRSGRFVLDLAAGRTVLTRAALPAGSEVRPLASVAYSVEGRQTGSAAMEALGGAVAGFAGTTTLPSLALGPIRWRGVAVNVIESSPKIGGAPIDGILGLDLLSSAPVLRLELGETGRALLALRGQTTSDGVEVPFSRAASHLFVTARVGEHPLRLVIDSGAKVSILPAALASALGLSPVVPPRTIDLRGLDGRVIAAVFHQAPSLRLGEQAFRDVSFAAAPGLPVFKAWGLGDETGILGNDFFARFSALEIDFDSGLLRLES